MNQLYAVMQKELYLLLRDKIGLIVLFVMPVIFVVLITWVQFSNVDDAQAARVTVILVDQDNGDVSRTITQALQSSGIVQLKTATQGHAFSLVSAEAELQKGHAQGILVLPPNASVELEQMIKKHLIGQEAKMTAPLQLILDPSLPGGMQNIVTASLNQIMTTLQLQLSNQILGSVLGTPVSKPLNVSELIQISNSVGAPQVIKPNPVQQNVPAWAIFGMFFIIVPLGNVLIGERTHSVFQRSMMAPVSMFMLLFGKMLAYVIVNATQLGLMLMMGKTVLPWLGMQTLAFGPHWIWIVITGLCISLAAVGTGLFLGTLFKTERQLSMLAPMLVVIGAAAAGIMVPTYMMPKIVQHLSWLSPLHWSLDAFTNLFSRGLNGGMIFMDLGLLLVFFTITMTAAVLLLSRR